MILNLTTKLFKLNGASKSMIDQYAVQWNYPKMDAPEVDRTNSIVRWFTENRVYRGLKGDITRCLNAMPDVTEDPNSRINYAYKITVGGLIWTFAPGTWDLTVARIAQHAWGIGENSEVTLDLMARYASSIGSSYKPERSGQATLPKYL